jgi:formamidopyrimidine-DNA glycosylase
MPEMPEVESVRRGLEHMIVGKTFMFVKVLWDRIISTPDVATFQKDLIGETIESITRRGKYLIIHTTNFDLISHLRMEGKYEFHEFHSEPRSNPHIHVVFRFSDGTELRYIDVRKFGRMALVKKDEWQNYPGILKLGPEPLGNDFDETKFYQSLQRHSKNIKSVLLDQSAVAGLGNIYCDECLWLGKIHPGTPANHLTKKDSAALREAIINVLTKANEAGGTTIRSFINAEGHAGNFQEFLNVYGRTGEPCHRCETPIEKIKLSGRGTHFCPHCQILK